MDSLVVNRMPCRLGMPRIYLPVTLCSGKPVLLDRQASQHVVRVLRLKPGAPLILFNGEGGEYAARLETEERNAGARVMVGEFIPRDSESKLSIHLAQGIARGERMDYVIQKATELGVTRITPLFTEFCVVNIKEERAEKRLSHWRGIAIAAAEQCGRTRIPHIAMPLRLDEWLAKLVASMKIVLDPYAGKRLFELSKHRSTSMEDIGVLVGPEGGLSDSENILAQRAGFQAIQLGPRMLRTETTPVAMLAILQMLWGDLG